MNGRLCPALARPAGTRETHLIMAAKKVEWVSGMQNEGKPQMNTDEHG
jgi:hypothetical protein